jgi:hypothetical protein
MSKLLATALALVAILPACASASVPGEPLAAPRSPAACASIAAKAAERVQGIASAQRACSTDADCVLVAQGASCFDHCTTSMALGGKAALDAMVADVDAHECREFAAQGCRVEVPPCAPPPAAAACRAGQCQ